jgi:thioredoxin-related protein
MMCDRHFCIPINAPIETKFIMENYNDYCVVFASPHCGWCKKLKRELNQYLSKNLNCVPVFILENTTTANIEHQKKSGCVGSFPLTIVYRNKKEQVKILGCNSEKVIKSIHK